MTITQWLTSARTILKTHSIDSSRIDSEIILAHTLRKDRTWLHAHSEDEIDPRFRDIADARLQLRTEHVPIAYIIGHKEFYGRLFHVTPATLVPRPESEAMITLAHEYLSDHPNATHLVDVGTGSGCLGITMKLEHPALDVSLIDISNQALKVAEKNAQRLQADVRLVTGSLLKPYVFTADMILANLPYVNHDWDVSPDTRHEPSLALFARQDGHALIYELIDSLPGKLSSGGALILEADERQHPAIITYSEQKDLQHVRTEGLALLFTYQ